MHLKEQKEQQHSLSLNKAMKRQYEYGLKKKVRHFQMCYYSIFNITILDFSFYQKYSLLLFKDYLC